MGSWQRDILCFVILASFLLLVLVECKKKKKKPSNSNSNETTLFNFLRLVVYRLIYGFATMIGQQETVSEFMGGIFVPPGEDDGDYRDYLDGDDDDDDDDYRDYDSYDY